MNFHDEARTLVHEAALGVAFGRPLAAEKLICEALQKAQNETESRLRELEAEIVKLRKALACYYPPTSNELCDWEQHCDIIRSAGGVPPNEDEWWANLALNHWELKT